MKLQCLQNKVLYVGKFPRNNLIRDIHTSFQIPYIYNFITKLCKQQAKVIQHHENIHVRNIGKEKPGIENIRDLNLAVVRHMIPPTQQTKAQFLTSFYKGTYIID
jgi:hypothetical protein